MTKQTKALLKKTLKEQLPIKAEVILPSSIPANKQMWVDQRSKEIQDGLTTYEEVGKELKLSVQEITFSRLFMTGELQGNAHEAAITALELDPQDKDDRKKASQWISLRVLPNHPCMILGKTFLHGLGYNDVNVDKELLWLMEQRSDLRAKIQAIDLYNKLTGRLKKQVEVTHNHNYDFSSVAKKDILLANSVIEKARVTNDAHTNSYLPTIDDTNS